MCSSESEYLNPFVLIQQLRLLFSFLCTFLAFNLILAAQGSVYVAKGKKKLCYLEKKHVKLRINYKKRSWINKLATGDVRREEGKVEEGNPGRMRSVLEFKKHNIVANKLQMGSNPYLLAVCFIKKHHWGVIFIILTGSNTTRLSFCSSGVKWCTNFHLFKFCIVRCCIFTYVFVLSCQ